MQLARSVHEPLLFFCYLNMPPIRSQKEKSTQHTRTAISVSIKKEICEFIEENP